MQPTDQLRIRSGGSHLHRLGQRATVEALLELASRTDAAIVLEVLAEYRRISPEQIRAAGADRPLRRLVGVPR